MSNNSLPPGLKRDLETACKNVGKKVKRMVPGIKNKGAMVCFTVKF